MRPWLLLVMAQAGALPLAGCCTIARGLCGPDRTPWIQIDFATPESAARTFLEALRRDDPEVVYRCLSHECRKRLGIDGLAAQLAWTEVRRQYPYLHVAGYAAVPAAERRGADRARLRLDVEGRVVEVDLVRQAKWEVRYRRADGSLYEPGALLADAATVAAIAADPADERSTLQLQPLRFRHDGLDAVALDDVEFAGMVRDWKIAGWTAANDG
ncbi:MAG: hypothetical protein ACK5BN_16675 [Planctomycetota bacterium]